MKSKRLYLVVIAALLGGALLLGRSFAQEHVAATVTRPSRVAVCDVVQVFNNYTRAKDLSAQLNESRDKVEAEGQKRQQAIQSMQLELEGLKEGSKEYEGRFNEIQRQTIEQNAWLQYQEALVMREHHRLTREMYDEIIQRITQLAKEKSIDIVLYRMRQEFRSENTRQLLQQIENRRVLYAADSTDLTDEVLAGLNEAYRIKTK